jgi:hypothetical protein
MTIMTRLTYTNFSELSSNEATFEVSSEDFNGSKISREEHRQQFLPTLQIISKALSRKNGYGRLEMDFEKDETWLFIPRSKYCMLLGYLPCDADLDKSDPAQCRAVCEQREKLFLHARSCTVCGEYKRSITINHYNEWESGVNEITTTRTKCMCPKLMR